MMKVNGQRTTDVPICQFANEKIRQLKATKLITPAGQITRSK